MIFVSISVVGLHFSVGSRSDHRWVTASHGKSDLAPPQNARLCLAHAFPPIAHHLKKHFLAPFSFLVLLKLPVSAVLMLFLELVSAFRHFKDICFFTLNQLCLISDILWYCWAFPASPCRLIHSSSFSVSCYCSGFLAMGSSFPISLQILCVCGIEKMSSASDIEQNIVEWKTWVFITFCVELCAFIDWVYQRGIQWRIALKQKHGTNNLSYISMQYCQN